MWSPSGRPRWGQIGRWLKGTPEFFTLERCPRSAGPWFWASLEGHTHHVIQPFCGNGAPISLNSRYRESEHWRRHEVHRGHITEASSKSEAQRLADAAERVQVSGVITKAARISPKHWPTAGDGCLSNDQRVVIHRPMLDRWPKASGHWRMARESLWPISEWPMTGLSLATGHWPMARERSVIGRWLDTV